MSEINYDAIGRCEVLKEKIRKLVSERDMFNQRFLAALRSSTNGFQNHIIAKVQVGKLEEHLNELKIKEAEIRSTVEDYNSWAKLAGKQDITFMSY